MKKIALITVWIGKVPDYYYFHRESMKNQNNNIDVFFITDQDIDKNDLPNNYFILKTDEKKIKDRYFELTGRKLNRNLSKGYHGMALSYLFDFFDEIKYEEYDFVSIYDIDTLFGDIYSWVKPFLETKDYISIGGGVHHHRLSGPLCLLRNNEEVKKVYYSDEYLNHVDNGGIGWVEEKMSQKLKGTDKAEIIQKSQNVIHKTSKVLYDCVYSGGKVFCNNENILCYHFIDKKNTRLERVGNTIIASHRKKLAKDFYWVTCFTENYEPMIEGLVESVKKYSNRKIIMYTINYDSDLRFRLNEQFIFRRIDIPKGEIDRQGRDINIISCKPLIMSDSIKFDEYGKFVFIDTDIYLTNTCDKIGKYFNNLDNYPLCNSHIHDRILANDISDDGEWKSPIDILSKETGIPVRVYPRRKTNVIVYDKKSEWFFKEQIQIYNEYKNRVRGIFRLHDEDSANILLSKYNYQKSLPLVDMEESNTLNINKFQKYSYHRSDISQHVKLPENLNEIYVFHGFKNPSYYKEIEENYGKTVLDNEDFIISYEDNLIKFTKNNFLTGKEIKNLVTFKVYDEKNKLLCQLSNQMLFNYWVFFIGNVDLKNKKLKIEIEEVDGGRIIYKNIKQF